MASTVASATRRRSPKLRWCGDRSAACAHPDDVERRRHAALELGAAQPEVGRPERDVLADRRHEQLVVGILEHDPDATADLAQVLLLDRQPAHGRPLRAAATRMPFSVQDERRLAGAVGTEHGHPLAGLDGRGRRRAAPGDRPGTRSRRRGARAPRRSSDAPGDHARPSRRWPATAGTRTHAPRRRGGAANRHRAGVAP